MIPIVAVGVAVALSVGLLLYGLARALEPESEVERRIDAWVRSDGTDTLAKDEASGDLFERMDRSIARRGFANRTAAELARADLKLTVTEYLFARAGLTLLGFVAGFLFHREPLAGLLLAAVGFFLPVVYLRSRQSRRLAAFNSQLPDVLDHLVGSLRAGYGLLQSIEWVSKQMPNPAGLEFERVIREVQLGRGLRDALDSMVRRIASDDLALIITAINIQHESGGSLAEILATVAHTIRERVRIQREIGVLTAQQRYSGYVLMLMPIALAIFLFLISPQYESQLFQPGPTLCIPIGAGIMMIVGFFAMRRIVNIEV
jgi:tight adherence protein B